MGGYPHTRNTTLLLPGGGFQKGYNLQVNSWFSCAIEDPESDSVILTGGYEQTGQPMQNVVRYGENGFIEHLANMTFSRARHGCAGYYDDNKNLVRDAFQIKKEKNFRQLSKRWEGVTLKPRIKIGN